MTTLTRQLKEGAEQAFETLAEGWRELRARAGGALTRFRSNDDDALRGGGVEGIPRLGRWAFMAADVIERDDRIVVRLEAPGMRREDFQVEVRGQTLRIHGEKRVDHESTSGGYRLVQCAYGAFDREIRLPGDVEVERAAATYRDGVLRVELPKAPGGAASRFSVPVS
ncbi:Hsp20/alpha crystallin family protein [Piscinibacter koreensis]|uniref:Hsp20/alpha crystallin family protein n=1 Tax=Piscinibacter koreensis TaxID=2742824 RepID=A0A7Y6NMA8_9BURK|nr:Hsp20/alpha crystallin family protein [Schlegelella koreensis]NUZ05818.1 Hsp20/alpha crystallin family protein [Schlegelella koreensis]